MTDQWKDYYNFDRPHENLDNMTPIEYREMGEDKDIYLDITV